MAFGDADDFRRWVFIFDGIITVVVAIYGYVFFPDTPYNTQAFYLSAEEKARCVERLVEDGREETSNFNWALFKRAFGGWKIYVLTILFCFWNTTVGKVSWARGSVEVASV
jgi:MFS transporter, ACS family, pantothenate transporter